MTLMSLVNSISDQTFRFGYISWLFSEWDCVWTQLSQFRLKIFKKRIFFLNIGHDRVMKRWHFRAPWSGVFPKCHFINHWMDLAISWFSPDYIDTEHIIEITPQNTFIKSSAVWEAHKKCLGNVLTLTWDLLLSRPRLIFGSFVWQ